MSMPTMQGGGMAGQGPAQPLVATDTTSIGDDPPGAGGDALPGGPTTVGREAGGSGPPERATSSGLLDIVALIGMPVSGHDDATLGKVSRVLADPASGRLAYVVITPIAGWVNGPRALPWPAVAAHCGEGRLRLPYGADTLRMAPGLRDGRIPENDADWVQRVHAFFGCRPYWVA